MGRSTRSEDGNVFIAIFGAIAMVGILGASVMTFMKGPLATSVKLTKMNAAENQMAIGAQVAVMATASQANNGDCELIDPDGAGPLPAVGDSYVEPIEWRTPTTEPIPTGGGLVPLSLGISKKDPWGTEYGYCVWNHGPSTSANGCGTNMLAGTNSKIYPVVSLISAGPDKAFTTTCRSFATADVNGDFDLLDATDLQLVSKASESDDDIITSFTYDEATGASGGLWSIKSGFPDTAVISKNIETTGTASLKGGLLLPDKSFVTCDASTAGVMAMNGSAIEICDGTAWEAITGGAVGGSGLILNPNVSTGMNIDGTCGTATCYSTQVTFEVTNNLTPAAASDVLVVNLSNTTNFEKVSDNCNGNSIATGTTCQIVVRAKASGNVSYAATLNIIGNNSPLAMLDGVASNFPGCNVGGNAPGGLYVACGVGSGYNIITTPSGCGSGTSNPICTGGTDTFSIVNCTHPTGFNTTGTDGLLNTVNLMAYSSGGPATFPPASYCSSLVYAGFDDWYLPSTSELQAYFYPNRTAINLAATIYGSSNYSNPAAAGFTQSYLQADGNTGARECGRVWNYRCARRDPSVVPSVTVDTAPDTVSFAPSYGGASETRTSNGITILGITEPISISVSGGIGAQISKNGGAYSSSSTTATNGDQITLRATSPAFGQESVVSLTMGSTTANWQVRTPGNNTIRVFTTSTAYTGSGSSFGGSVGGADTVCTTTANAQGLPGNWVSVMAFGINVSVADRLPWNWKTLRNMNNQTVAVSLPDFMDGSISAAMNYTQTGALAGGSGIWTGIDSTGLSLNSSSIGENCASWATSSGGNTGRGGDSSSTASGAYFSIGNPGCATSRRLLCMETNQAGADTNPNAVSLRPRVTFASGGTGTSNTVTITGVTDEIPVEIIPSAGTADIIKDGLSVGGTTTMAGLNQTLAFTLTAPTTLGQRNTATITLGPDSYTWWVGYADSTKEAKVFITSTTYNTGNFGGLSGMDSICVSHASTSSYGLSSSWVAMASDSNTDMANRIPWNWGSLKTVTGTVIANGYTDLLDGALLNPINVMENGSTNSATGAATGSDSAGMRYSPYSSTPPAANFHNDWTFNGCTGGIDGAYGNVASTTQWAYIGAYNGNCGTVRLYCIENVDSTVLDTTPASIALKYAIQVPVSSRQTSAATTISGLSNGATATLSVTATSGSPTFKVNGGPEVTSGTIQNGDSVVFLLTAPASGNTSNKMTITSGSMTAYWRVWTGDTTGSIVKRVFVTNSPASSTNTGGIINIDGHCQSRASSAGLGGTWKVIASGEGTDEDQWAVNRIGYNWSTLRRIDGADVTLAGNIWSSDITPLLNPIAISQTGATISTTFVRTGTTVSGRAAVRTINGQCANYSNGNSYDYAYSLFNGTSGSTSTSWIYSGSNASDYGYGTCAPYYFGYIYCIEQ